MLTPGARRLAREQAAAKSPTPQGADTGRIEPAVVSAVAAGGGTDGVDLATVTFRGAAQKAAHLQAYTPVVGHTVALWVSAQGSLLILDRIVGTPPSS